MSNVVVIGVDPGKSTGIAVLVDGFFHSAYQVDVNDVRSILWALVDQLEEQYGAKSICIAVEKYTQGSRTGARTVQRDPERVINIVTDVAFGFDVTSVNFQQPSVAKTLISKPMLRKLGLVISPASVDRRDSDDANDAMRHALTHIAQHHNRLFNDLILQQMLE